MSGTSSVILNGNQVLIPKNFFDVGVVAAFQDGNVQANLTTEEFTFILDGYQAVVDWINEGRTSGLGIFEGIPLQITHSDGNNNTTIFNGILDLQAGTTIFENLRELTAPIRQDNSINQLAELIEPLDFGYLKELGVITSSDYVNVDYVVNPTDNGLATITTFVTIYLLSKQLADTIKEIGTTAATISGITASGITGAVGAAIYAVAVAILQIAYAAALLILIIDFGQDLLNILVQPLRTHKAIPLKTLIEKTCEYIGYEFNTSIEDLDNLVYLPSNINVDQYGEKNVLQQPGEITEGIPNATDAGYTCTQLFEILRDLFNARFAILGKTVEFHTENADFWIRQSSWEKPTSLKDVDRKPARYNTDEIKGSILIQFETDINDEYTINNYKGTSYQVLTDAKAVNNPKNKTIKGLDAVRIPFALGNRKEQLNFFEQALVPLANLFDNIADVFGRNPNLAKKIKTKVGVLEVTNNNHTVPKLLWLEGGRIPSNNRDVFSAKTLWDKYHNEKSFIQNNFGRQRRYVEGEIIPFGLSDFVTLLDNSYFRDENGASGKITNIEWNMSRDEATINYWLQEVYTTNLKETFIEPD